MYWCPKEDSQTLELLLVCSPYGLYDNGPKVLGLFLPFFLGSWGCLGLLLINIEDDYGI